MSRQVHLCTCNRSIPLERHALAEAGQFAGAGAIRTYDAMCRHELARLAETAKADTVVACTQEMRLLGEALGDAKRVSTVRFVNVRETAGWSKQGAFSGPKIAALVAEAMLPEPAPTPVVNYRSGGQTLFSWLATLSKTLHNFVGPVFVVACLLLFLTFVRDNWPKAVDLKWIAAGGGLFNDKHIPSERFNAGEKVWFWGGVMLLGIIVGGSGLVLNFPNFGQTRATMQLASLIHLGGSIIFMIGALGHIYMGTVGVAGAYQAMKNGSVDEAWAKEHHELWYEDIKAGKIPVSRSAARSAAAGQAQPAGGDD